MICFRSLPAQKTQEEFTETDLNLVVNQDLNNTTHFRGNSFGLPRAPEITKASIGLMAEISQPHCEKCVQLSKGFLLINNQRRFKMLQNSVLKIIL
jgi:hypothetical protein